MGRLWDTYCSSKYHHKMIDPNSPIQLMIATLLYFVVKDNASCIIFGEPIKPYKIGEIQQQKQTNNKKEVDSFLESLAKKSTTTECAAIHLFNSSPITEIPVWQCVNEEYYPSAPIPLNLLNPLIEGFLAHEKDGVICGNEPGEKVFYSVGMEKNYCYSIKIQKTETF